jgi:hypothetical protein
VVRKRTSRKFEFSSGELALEVRLAPAIVSPIGVMGTIPTSHTGRSCMDDPLPNPEPAPKPPGTPPTPTSGPIGPGTS